MTRDGQGMRRETALAKSAQLSIGTVGPVPGSKQGGDTGQVPWRHPGRWGPQYHHMEPLVVITG